MPTEPLFYLGMLSGALGAASLAFLILHYAEAAAPPVAKSTCIIETAPEGGAEEQGEPLPEGTAL